MRKLFVTFGMLTAMLLLGQASAQQFDRDLFKLMGPATKLINENPAMLASNEGVWAPAAPAHQSLGSRSDRKRRSGDRRASTDTKRHQSSRRRSRSQSAFTDDSSDDGGGTRPQGDLPWVDARGQFVEAEWVSDCLLYTSDAADE